MKRLRVLAAAIALFSLIGLAIRLWWTAALSETGWETIGRHWSEATIDFAAERPVPLSFRPREEQAKFWLEETERIVKRHPRAPFAEARGEERQLKSWCDERCLEYAERATRLASGNLNWRRARARLLLDDFADELKSFGCDTDSEVRWQAILDDCRRHDADNALYDYMAAHILWLSSVAKEGPPHSDSRRWAYRFSCRKAPS